jgi:DNA-binding SARP family transcriptional activator
MAVHNLPTQTTAVEMSMCARMNLLGVFALKYGEAQVTITSQRMQALLAYLALRRGEPESRQRLAFLLWPDSSESQAYTNLRTLLHRLYAVLPEDAYLIQADSHSIRWSFECALSLDVAEFEEELRRADAAAQDSDGASARASLERAVGRYSGDLLPDCYDEWILLERERLRQLLLTAVEQLVMLLEKDRHYSAAIPYARRLALLDPLNEDACLTLMRLHAVNGDRASALRVYHACASTLQAELGIKPGSALSAAYERLLAVEALSPGEAQVNSALPLVGRDQVWKRMQATWQVAASGQPRLLILSGEAGVGKTRLAEDLLRWASRQGMITAVTQCYPAEGDLAYTPVAALIRSDALRPGLKRLPAEWLSEITRVAPDLIAIRPDLQPPGPMTERWQRHRLFEALARAVLSAERPTLLFVDDLQWCDRDSLEWLHFLLRYSQRARLLVVGAMRIEEIDASHPVVGLLEALHREGRASEIALDPLNQAETAELAGYVAGRTLSHEEVEHLYAETEGNALFIVETMRGQPKGFVENGAFETDQFQSVQSSAQRPDLPPRVQAVIAWRLKQLSSEALAVLEAAAVIGRSFTFNVLARTAKLDENNLVRGLDELWQRRIVREQGPDAYDFTHGRLRSVAYAELSLARRRVLHRRVAEALETEYAAQRDAFSGQIAMHYERAGQVDQAVSYLRDAAAYARRLYAHEVAIAHFQHALALLGEQPLSRKADLYDLMGEVQHFIGRYEDARESWQHALDLTPDPDRLARANLYRKLGNAWRDQYRYDEALQAYDAAEDALGSLSPEDNEAVWSCWGLIKLERLNALYWLGQATDMLKLISQVQSAFEQRGSTLQRARLHQISVLALLRKNRYSLTPQAAEHARAYLSLVAETGDINALPAAHFQVGFAQLWGARDLHSAEAEIQVALSLAERSGDISLEARCLTYLTVIARMRGQVEMAQTYAEASLRVAVAGQMHDYVGAAHGNLAWLAWRNQEDGAVRSHGQAALEAWNRLPAGYMFEWIGRLPLIAGALMDGDLADGVMHARTLLDERQQQMLPEIDSALVAAIHAADAGDSPATDYYLQKAVDAARQSGYL